MWTRWAIRNARHMPRGSALTLRHGAATHHRFAVSTHGSLLQERALWRRATAFIDSLRRDPDEPTPPRSVSESASASASGSPLAEADSNADNAVTAGGHATSAAAVEEEDELDTRAMARRSVHHTLAALTSFIRKARSASQLTDAWAAIARHERVFLHLGGVTVAPASGDSPAVAAPEKKSKSKSNINQSHPNKTWRRKKEQIRKRKTPVLSMRMVSPEEWSQMDDQCRAQVIDKEGELDPAVLDRLVPALTGEEDASRPSNDLDGGEKELQTTATTLLLSEAFVARKLVVALSRLGFTNELVTFVETALDVSTLDEEVDAIYVSALGRQRAHAAVVAHCEPFAKDLSRFLALHRHAAHALLSACAIERRGTLARQAIDQSMDNFPLAVVPARSFRSALHASLRATPKTAEHLQDALHVYRRMRHEAGYVLHPNDWSWLLNSCMYLDHHAEALEVFASYRTHGIAPFQARFTRALRMACRVQRVDTAITMVETWIAIEEKRRQDQVNVDDREHGAAVAVAATNDATLSEQETQCLNSILWHMFKTSNEIDEKEDTPTANAQPRQPPTRHQVERVLKLMQSRQAPAGALVVRRIVSHFLLAEEEEEDTVMAAPNELAERTLQRFFSMWESCPDVIQRTGFVLYLVLEHCEAVGWDAQCDSVLAYGLRHRLDLPMVSAVHVMERWASVGDFDRVIALGEAILDEPSACTNLPEAFFEELLKSYLLRQRFEDATRLGETWQLQQRFAQNTVLKTLLHDAATFNL